MTARDRLFLIVSDRTCGTSEIHDLGHDVDQAMDAYRTREHELAGRDDAEVALVSSASLESLRRTHSSYFGAPDALAPILNNS
ncbi:MAG TPA: hypothetical protein VGF91_23600 [Solirubrobacteraceae bacterium]